MNGSATWEQLGATRRLDVAHLNTLAVRLVVRKLQVSFLEENANPATPTQLTWPPVSQRQPTLYGKEARVLWLCP